jgi:myo-inositol 2-dehydrogenase/D-chiro-inositol 1-dehydrogenase/scyllo-inositol 2-dehydrogenase (NAD+)
MKVRIGLIGCGRIAQRFHIKTLSVMENVELVALCDIREEIARKLASKYHVEKVYNDYKELLANEKIDAVVISAPTEVHFKILEDAAKAGKHIFVEKPLAETIEECKKAIEVCQKNKVKLMVGFMRRFDKALIWSKEKIKSGSLGAPFVINSRYNHVSTYGDYLQKTDSGIIGKGKPSPNVKENMHLFLINNLIHHADIMRWFGGAVNRLLATMVTFDNYFTLNVILKFSSKSMGHIQFNGLVNTDWQEELVIHGTLGSLYVKMFFPYLDTPSSAILISKETNSRISPLNVVNTMYEDELRYFINCIINDLEPEPNGYQALEAQMLISAIEKSLEQESWIDVQNE